MNHYARLSSSAAADRIVQAITHQQFVWPHQSLGEALEAAGRAVGFCPGSVAQALECLGLGAQTIVGRLRRTEIIQLARTVDRFWRQTVAGAAGHAQPG